MVSSSQLTPAEKRTRIAGVVAALFGVLILLFVLDAIFLIRLNMEARSNRAYLSSLTLLNSAEFNIEAKPNGDFTTASASPAVATTAVSGVIADVHDELTKNLEGQGFAVSPTVRSMSRQGSTTVTHLETVATDGERNLFIVYELAEVFNCNDLPQGVGDVTRNGNRNCPFGEAVEPGNLMSKNGSELTVRYSPNGHDPFDVWIFGDEYWAD